MLPRSKRGESKLIHKGKAHFGVLQHVIEAQVFHQVCRRVDLLVAVPELGFNDKRRWVAVSARRRMVGAGIAALGFHIWNITVLPTCKPGKKGSRVI